MNAGDPKKVDGQSTEGETVVDIKRELTMHSERTT